MNLKKLLSTFLWVLILVISVPCLAYEGLTVKIGYAQGLELYHQSSILKETLEYLQKKIPNYRFELLPISSVDTQEDIKKEKIDFLIAPSNFFVELSGGIPFTHLASRIFDGTKDPAKTVGSTFVVRAERNDIQSIKDLRGKNCAASLPDSLGGWLAALGEIKEHGFDPDNFFKTKNFTQFQVPDVLNSVLSGSSDVGILSTCILEEAEALGMIEKGSLRVINKKTDDLSPIHCARSTQLYSDMSFVSLQGVPEPLVREVTVALLSMPVFDHSRWSVENDQYSIRKLLRELRLGPYSYLRGNSLTGLAKRYKTEIIAFVGILLFLIFNEFNLRRLVNKRTRQLSDALKAKEEADREAAEERKKFATLEKNGIIAQLGTIIAHEAKQPIATLTNYLQIFKMYLDRKNDNDAFSKDVFENMENQVSRLNTLVNSVRNFAKQKQNPQIKTDLVLITQKAIRSLEATEPDIEKVKISFNSKLKTALVLADPFSLELLILNLLRNGAQEAVSNTAKGSPILKVELSLSNDNKSFILLVENSGNLMTDKDLSRLVSLGESVKPDGLGLGLSIIRGIADLHGADLGFTGRDKGGVIASLRIDQLHV